MEELDKYRASRKKYMDKLSKSIASDKPEVPTPWLEYRDGYPIEHEGRHRAIAARDAGKEKIPVYKIYKKGDEESKKKVYRDMSKIEQAGERLRNAPDMTQEDFEELTDE